LPGPIRGIRTGDRSGVGIRHAASAAGNSSRIATRQAGMMALKPTPDNADEQHVDDDGARIDVSRRKNGGLLVHSEIAAS
jgi:hypothetical protein